MSFLGGAQLPARWGVMLSDGRQPAQPPLVSLLQPDDFFLVVLTLNLPGDRLRTCSTRTFGRWGLMVWFVFVLNQLTGGVQL